MVQIGTVRLETQNSGVVDVPVFEPGDSASGIYEFVRVETASGPGFIPVTAPADATYPYLRVQSQNNGIVAVTDTPGSDIPDSALAQYNAVDDTQATGAITTVPDQLGSLDLSGNASLVSSGINANQSYQFNGSSDFVERDYTTFNQPFTIFVAVELLDDTKANTPFTGFSGRTEIYWNTEPADNDNANWAMFAGGSVVEGGPADTTAVLTAAFNGASSFLRVNGTEVASGDVGSNDSGGVVLGYNKQLSTRYLDGYLGEALPVDGVPTSQTISEQEQRIANAYGITLA